MSLKKKRILKIGIIGCGAIGSSLAKTIAREFSGQARLVSLFDLDSARSRRLAKKLHMRGIVAAALEAAIRNVDLVIEASSAAASLNIAQKTISYSRDIMIMSVGGIINDYKKLSRLAAKNGSRIFIPSGAICGIDGLKAAGCARIKKVTLTTKKHPKSFSGVAYLVEKRINLDNIREDKIIFQGNAVAAVKAFPQNINVAATLSIAGIGPEKTFVRIVASPSVTQNTHEVEIESNAARIISRTENTLHPDNPKTSYLAVLSAVATLRQIIAPLKIGN